MKLFVLSNQIPSQYHTPSGAVTMVQYHVLSQLRQQGHGVTLQNIYQSEDRRPLTSSEMVSLDELQKLGIEVMPVLFRSDYIRSAGRSLAERSRRFYTRFVRPLEYFYPAVRLRPIIERRIMAASADVVFIFWNSEGLAATYGTHSVPKFVYYGMPDHMGGQVRLQNPELFCLKVSTSQLARLKQLESLREKYHLKLMMDCDVTANLCAEHVEYYARKGHPRSIYMQNIWPENPAALSMTAPQGNGRLKIFGSLGTLRTTGNTFGLKFIGEQLVPRLNHVFGPEGYEIHIFGNGEPLPMVRKVLEQPAIKIRGWVDDIDSEIRSSHIFLVANNTGPYKGAHTRFLHAWSLKACCIADSYNSRAMPEIVHMKNTLLGDTPDEIVGLIVRSVKEAGLRQMIGQAGWQTFKKCFTPEAVVGRLVNEIEGMVKPRDA